MRVGVEPAEEAARVRATLTGSGFEVARRLEGEGFVALGFAHPEGRRAVRVITSRGVAAALDSHEPDGVRTRHGAVRLLAPDEGDGHDRDGDGLAEVVVARDAAGATCLAILRVGEDGRVTLAPTDAERLAPGACPSALADVDGDGTPEVLVELRWPDLTVEGMEAPPSLRAALVLDDGAWRASGLPVVYARRERARRLSALEAARRGFDVPAAIRLAVELAALAHLTGASVAAQVERFDEALAGVVLTRAQVDRVAAIRAVIGGGWRAPEE